MLWIIQKINMHVENMINTDIYIYHIYTYIGFMPLGSNSKSPLGFFKAVLGLGIPTNLHLPRLLLGGGHTQMILYIYRYIANNSDQTWISRMASSFNKRCLRNK